MSEDTVTMFCVKCREKREVKDVVPTTMKNGKPAMSAVCTVCGTKTFQIGSGAAKK